MTVATTIEPHISTEEEKAYLQDQLNRVCDPTLSQLDRVLRRHAAFHAFFLVLVMAEAFLFFSFFATLPHSSLAALSLAVIFFTAFAYFTLRLYLQTKKPEQLKTLLENYLQECKSIINYHEDNPEHYTALASACCKLANRLHAREYNYYRLPGWLEALVPSMEKLSCWCHWQDIHRMRELLLQASVNEHINLVKNQPTSLETHAALANAYVMLSGLYIDLRKMEGYEDDRWIPAEKYNEDSMEKFRVIAERAIEEFMIIGEYAPDDPWVHCQLAYSYHDLQMPLEEIKEYEAIQRLIPEDKDNLHKLGILYFQQGWNAKGLRVYEELKRAHYNKAEHLIEYYGTYGQPIS